MKKGFDILQILSIALIVGGLIGAILQFTIWLNMLFMYPLGAGLSILIVLASFEIIERASREDKIRN